MSTKQIAAAVARGDGVLFAEPAMVGRPSYAGRNIIAKNSAFNREMMDDRGYLTVEWWIMSKTQCLNDIQIEGEGLTRLVLGTSADGSSAETISFADAVALQPTLLLGKFVNDWPLIKILDIGSVSSYAMSYSIFRIGVQSLILL